MTVTWTDSSVGNELPACTKKKIIYEGYYESPDPKHCEGRGIFI